MKIDGLNCMIDLHLHLDGAISPENAKELAKIQDIAIPDDEKEFSDLLQLSGACCDLNEFLRKFAFPCSLMQTELGITTSVKNLIKESAEQGLMYAEIRFAPQNQTKQGLSQERVVSAAIKGCENSPIEVQLILCAMRGDDKREANLETVRLAKKFLGCGVCAVDLAGAEGIFATKDYAEIFEYAKKEGVPFTIHAGEADGAESVKTALDFGACRIGHGVRSIEDEELIKRIAEEKIPLEVCPSSNICTGVYKTISGHPIKKLIDSGVRVTVNTDDPGIENTTIKEEFKLVCREFGLGEDDILKLLLNSVCASFAPEKTKEAMKERIFIEFGRIDANKLHLYKEQKKTLDTFLSNGAITKKQYNKSLTDLRALMKIPEELY